MTQVFIDSHDNFHPYECGGIKEGCIHCLAIKKRDKNHMENCALCEDGLYWDKPEMSQVLKKADYIIKS